MVIPCLNKLITLLTVKMQSKITIYGSAGTGKTTKLMNLIESTLKSGTLAEEIAFVSFTKKGVREGLERATELFDLKEEDTKHFGTLHSLCFAAIGMRRENMLTKKHYKLMSDKIGMKFAGFYTADYTSPDDKYLHAINMKPQNKAKAVELIEGLPQDVVRRVDFAFMELKRQLGLKDFNDLLVDFVKEKRPLPVKVAFIDEAQDLTPLQWDVAKLMFQDAEVVYAAGDDDQAIYEWSGADVHNFLNFSKESLVLNKSFRLPKAVFDVSQRVVKDIAVRKRKKLTHNGSVGEVTICSDFDTIDWKGGELVLARTNYLLDKLINCIMESGLLFTRKGQLSVKMKTLEAIAAYEAYCKGGKELTLVQKTEFKEVNKDKHWKSVIHMSEFKAKYYEKVLSTKSFTKEAIKFETFHSCKGSENDNVYVAIDLSKRVYDNMWRHEDEELRCLYVAVTRSKKNLTIIAPKSKRCYNPKYFI